MKPPIIISSNLGHWQLELSNSPATLSHWMAGCFVRMKFAGSQCWMVLLVGLDQSTTCSVQFELSSHIVIQELGLPLLEVPGSFWDEAMTWVIELTPGICSKWLVIWQTRDGLPMYACKLVHYVLQIIQLDKPYIQSTYLNWNSSSKKNSVIRKKNRIDPKKN